MIGPIALTFFVISLFVIVPFLYYYRNRNPNPRFRPRFGEMVLVAILAIGVAGGTSLGIAMLMGIDPERLSSEFDPGGRGKTSGDDDRPMGGGGGDSGGDPLDALLGGD